MARAILPAIKCRFGVCLPGRIISNFVARTTVIGELRGLGPNLSGTFMIAGITTTCPAAIFRPAMHVTFAGVRIINHKVPAMLLSHIGKCARKWDQWKVIFLSIVFNKFIQLQFFGIDLYLKDFFPDEGFAAIGWATAIEE